MPVYTVHAPVNSGADLSATDKFAFARDGFHFWAMVFGVFWLAWHRLWLALIGWTVLMVAVHIGLPALGVGRGAVFAVNLLLALFSRVRGGEPETLDAVAAQMAPARYRRG